MAPNESIVLDIKKVPSLSAVAMAMHENMDPVKDRKQDPDVRSKVSQAAGSVKGSQRGSVIKDIDARSIRSGIVGDEKSVRSETQSVINLRKKTQLKDTLIKKLLDKYHPGIANSDTEQMIHDEVNRLMQMSLVSEEDLRIVEAKIRKQSNDDIAAIATSPFKRITAFKSGAKDEWAKVNKKQIQKGDELEAQKLAEARRQKEQFRKELRKQISEVEARKREEMLEKEEDSQRIMKDVKRYISDVDRKKKEQVSRFEQFRQDRQEEMRVVKERKIQARESRIKEEEQAMDQIKQQQLKDMMLQREKKQEVVERLKVWRKENDLNLAAKEKMKQKQVEEEMAMAKRAQEVADARERKRAEELEELKAKMKARDAFGAALGETMAAQAAADEERMIRIQKELKEKEEKVHQERIAKAKKMKVELRSSLDAQMQDQQRRKKEEKRVMHEQYAIFHKQAMDAHHQAEEKEKVKRAKQEQYRLQLEDQLRNVVKVRPSKDLLMLDIERKFNREYLDSR